MILIIAEAVTRPVLAGGRHPVKHASDRTQTVIQLACADAKGAEIAGKGYLVIQGIRSLSACRLYPCMYDPRKYSSAIDRWSILSQFGND